MGVPFVVKVLGEIARGGFGVVERVRLNGEIVARKTFDPLVPLASEELIRLSKRFQRECELKPRFHHRALCPYSTRISTVIILGFSCHWPTARWPKKSRSQDRLVMFRRKR